MIGGPVLVQAMHGLGDNIYLRPFVRALTNRHEPVYVRTPWPQLYADLEVRCLPADSDLRTQALNEARGWRWAAEPDDVRKTFLPRYHPWHLERGETISAALESGISLGGEALSMDLPARLAQPPIINTRGRPLAVVRPNTVRREWANPARNPDPRALARVVTELLNTHHVVSVADADGSNEVLEEPLPPAHERYHAAELTIWETLELLRRAHVAVGGVGWLVPAALALRVPTFIVRGGQGAHNRPEVIVDPRLRADWVGFCNPDDPCYCSDREHRCNKRVADPAGQFRAWATARGVLTP